jgi:hypothetical protein
MAKISPLGILVATALVTGTVIVAGCGSDTHTSTTTTRDTTQTIPAAPVTTTTTTTQRTTN